MSTARILLLAILGAAVIGCSSGGSTLYEIARKGEGRDRARAMVNEDGVDVDERDPDTGQTPLQVAVIRGHNKMVDTLLALGADPNVKDGNGLTPLDQATRLHHDKIARSLRAYGAESGSE